MRKTVFSWMGLVFAAIAGTAVAGGQLSLSGTVINTVTGTPVRYAQVALLSNGGRTQTDAAGAFEFSHLEPGDYLLIAGKQGFISPEDEEGGIQISLTESRSKCIVHLAPLAAVRGRIVDDSGDPVEGATVLALQSEIDHGRRRRQMVGAAQTNDRGEYRIPGLRAGQYLIHVSGKMAHRGYYGKSGPSTSPDAFAPVFFGGSNDPAQAALLPLAAGVDARADLRVSLQPGRTIRGRIAGYRPHTTAILQLSSGEGDLGWNVNSLEYETGRFAISGVLDGTYRLRAYQNGDTEVLFGEQKIEVAGQDVDGVTVSLSPASTVKGTVRVEGSGTAAPELSIALEAQDAFLALAETSRFRESDEIKDGRLQVQTVIPGKYWISFAAGEGQYVAAARAGQADLLATQELLVNAGAPQEIEVVLRTDGGSITGTPPSPAANVRALVLLVPESCNRPAEVSGLEQGTFQFTDVAPGKYRLYAWKDHAAVEYGSPAALCALSRGGAAVEVTAGSETKVQLLKPLEESR